MPSSESPGWRPTCISHRAVGDTTTLGSRLHLHEYAALVAKRDPPRLSPRAICWCGYAAPPKTTTRQVDRIFKEDNPRAKARSSSGAAKRRKHLAVGVSPWNPATLSPEPRRRRQSSLVFALRQARASAGQFVPGRLPEKSLQEAKEPFAQFASRWDLLPGRVVIPGSAGVPPAQDLAGSWRLASQGWSVHLPTGAGAAPLQECGRDARAPRGKPMAGQVQIRILQKALKTNTFSADAQPGGEKGGLPP